MLVKKKINITVRIYSDYLSWNQQNYTAKEDGIPVIHKLIPEKAKYLYEMCNMKNFAIYAYVLLTPWTDVTIEIVLTQGIISKGSLVADITITLQI